MTARRTLSLLVPAVLLPAFAAGADVVEYYHLDAIGNVRAVTDQGGQVIERHDYLPFGEECTTGPCASNPGVGAGQPRKFTGKERDAETGLDYFGARYYASKIGRFTTVDPVYTWRENLVDPQRWNRYAYARNNPLRYVDPDGRVIQLATPDTYIDLASLGYGIADIVTTYQSGSSPTAAQWLGVAGDVVGVAVPFATGIGAAIRAGNKIDNAIDAGKGVDFTADLSQTAAKSRSGHSYAGNKQLHETMARDPTRRSELEAKYGSDALDRTSTSGGGRRNPRGAEWDHSSTDPKGLDLRSKEGHLEKTRREGQAGGGWKKFHRDKQE